MSNPALKRSLAQYLAQAKEAEENGRPLAASALMNEILVLSLNDKEAAVYAFIKATPACTRQDLFDHFPSSPTVLNEALHALIGLRLIRERRLPVRGGPGASLRLYELV